MQTTHISDASDPSAQGLELSYSVTLDSGKTLAVVPDRTRGLWALHFTSGGELPSSLSGRFTSFKDAVTAAKRYVESRETPRRGRKPKEAVNG